MSQGPQSPANKPGRGCRSTALRLGCGTAVVLIAIAAAAVYGLGRRSAHEVAAELLRLQSAGEPISATELSQAYALDPATLNTTDQWLGAALVFGSGHFREDSAEVPMIGFRAADQSIPPLDQQWPELPLVRKLLQKYQPTMSRLHHAAGSDGLARYTTDYSAGYATKLNHLMDLRMAARMLQLEALVKARDGDVAGAAQSIRTSLRLSESLKDQPILMTQLVRLGTFGNAAQSIQNLLPYVEFADADLEMLQRELERHSQIDDLRHALIGERVLGLMAINDPASLMQDQQLTKSTREAIRLRQWSLMWRHSDRAYFLHYMREFLDIAEKPWPTRLMEAKQLEDQLDQERAARGILGQFKYTLSYLLVPSDIAFEMHAGTYAVYNVTRTAVASERFRRKQSRLPRELNELVPDYLPSVPIDPFDGNPVRYLVDGDHFRVYSIGRNRADDGGKGTLSEPPDIVFAVPPEPEPETETGTETMSPAVP